MSLDMGGESAFSSDSDSDSLFSALFFFFLSSFSVFSIIPLVSSSLAEGLERPFRVRFIKGIYFVTKEV